MSFTWWLIVAAVVLGVAGVCVGIWGERHAGESSEDFDARHARYQAAAWRVHSATRWWWHRVWVTCVIVFIVVIVVRSWP